MDKPIEFEATLKLKGILTEEKMKQFNTNQEVLDYLQSKIVSKKFKRTLVVADIQLSDLL
jgi:hypothetical protein